MVDGAMVSGTAAATAVAHDWTTDEQEQQEQQA